MKRAAAVGEAVAFGEVDAKDAQAEIRRDEADHLLRDIGQNASDRGIGVDQRQCGVGLMAACDAGDLAEKKTFVGELAVERRLGHAGGTGDIIARGPVEARIEQDRPCVVQHLRELATFADLVVAVGQGEPVAWRSDQTARFIGCKTIGVARGQDAASLESF